MSSSETLTPEQVEEGFIEALSTIYGEPVRVRALTPPTEPERGIPWLPGPVRVVKIPRDHQDRRAGWANMFVQKGRIQNDPADPERPVYHGWVIWAQRGISDVDWRRAMSAIPKVMKATEVNGIKGGACPFCDKPYKTDSPFVRHVEECALRAGGVCFTHRDPRTQKY